MPRLITAMIRHGDYQQLADTPSAHQPFPLTEKGLQQAREAGLSILKTIETQGWELAKTVDSSLQLRAWQTADTIIREINTRTGKDYTIVSHAELAERGVGSVANLTHHQIDELMQLDPRFPPLPANWKSDSHYRLPFQGAESHMIAGERVARHIRQRMTSLRNEISNDTLMLFVGHGAAFRHAAHLFGILEFDEIERLSMYHASPVYLEISLQGRWSHVGGDWKIRSRDEQPMD